jgi:hypothetical protein
VLTASFKDKVDGTIVWFMQGGVGIVPTDTSYCFVSDVHSHDGVER